MREEVIVIVGSGGMGAAIAHRLGSGCRIVLSDANSKNLDATGSRIPDSRCGPQPQNRRFESSSAPGLAATAPGSEPRCATGRSDRSVERAHRERGGDPATAARQAAEELRAAAWKAAERVT